MFYEIFKIQKLFSIYQMQYKSKTTNHIINPIKPKFIKLIIIGDSGVGKSSFLLRYTVDEFTTNFITTIGIDFRIKTVKYKGIFYRLQIWDTAGQERFHTLTKAYYRNSMGVIIMFSINDIISFNNVNKWVSGFVEDKNYKIIPKVLVGNKIDSMRVITSEDCESLAKMLDCKLFESSVKDNININEPIEYLIDQAIVKFELDKPDIVEEKNIVIDDLLKNKNESENYCCL